MISHNFGLYKNNFVLFWNDFDFSVLVLKQTQNRQTSNPSIQTSYAPYGQQVVNMVFRKNIKTHNSMHVKNVFDMWQK